MIDYKAYREIRRKFPDRKAKWVFEDLKRAAKYQPLPLKWKSRGNSNFAEFEHEGFHVRATWDYDKYADFDHLGTWKYERNESGEARITADAIFISEKMYRQYAGGYNPPSYRNCYHVFVPQISYREHFKGLRDMKCGRAEADILARSFVLDTLKRMLGDLAAYTLDVEVSKNDVVLGRASCGGIDLGDEYPDRSEYVEESIRDLMHEAIDDAKEKLDEIAKEAREQEFVQEGLSLLEELLAITEGAKDALSASDREAWQRISAKVADLRESRILSKE